MNRNKATGLAEVDKSKEKEAAEINYDKYDFRYDTKDYKTIFKKGLDEEKVRAISKIKNEPEWMTEIRVKALKQFLKMPTPQWGVGNLNEINYDDIVYYSAPGMGNQKNWKDVPDYVKETFDRLGIPEAEKDFLAGVGAQFDSEVMYHNTRKDLEEKGVIFLSMDEGLKQFPEIVKEHFAKVVPYTDNKFAALNTAVWSGGSFVYVPKGVKVDIPLQAYFRINSESIGQFERTLIIADEASQVHYIEGCFTKGNIVQTISGEKEIQNIKENELVLTHTSTYKPVIKNEKIKYSGDLYKIKYFGDTSKEIEATSEHPFLIVKREKEEYKNINWNPLWKTASEIRKGDYLAIPIQRGTIEKEYRKFKINIGKGRHGYKEEEIMLKTDKDFFRLIGYYLSERSVMGKNYLTFTFNKNERKYIEDTKELLAKFFNKDAIEQKPYKNGVSIVLCSTIATRIFEKEFGKGAKNKKIPYWVKYENIEKQKELLKTFWQGDGSFMDKKYSYGVKRMFRINTISRTLAKQTRDLLLRQNIFASINKQKRKENKQDIYCVYVGGKYLEKFNNIVETTNFNIKLKMNQIKSFAHIDENFAFVPIKNIQTKKVENIDVYNVEVEEDHTYVVNGIVVHNCTAPRYTSESLHSAVVEVIAKEGAKVRYSTIQNWANNIYNLVTKRAHAHKNATMEWVDGNLGSKLTMKYPAIYLLGEGARAEVMSVAIASKGQIQDAGAKILHLAPNTTSTVVSKSISKDGGQASYRGLLKVAKGMKGVRSNVRCDAILIDSESRTDTYPTIDVEEPTADISHEATVGRIGEEQLFYLTSRGIPEEEAITLIVLGFIQPFTKQIPLEYASELNKLIEMEFENSVG